MLGLIGASIVLGLSGPFGTFESLTSLPRFAYWAMVVLCTYTGAIFVISTAKQYLPQHWPVYLLNGAAGALAGPVVTLIVTLINFATFPDAAGGLNSLSSLPVLMLYCSLITIAVAVLVGQADGNPSEPSEEAKPAQPPPLLARLPYDLRGSLVSLQAQDHYVQVTTTKGSTMVLMRIADAIAETGSVDGLKTHRSYWVAIAQVSSAEQIGERGRLILQNGSAVPVSRKYMPALKEAGLFPRQGITQSATPTIGV
ncbi:LytTR family DNA-binding domain-containing protein [Neptunicoccus cionae]|uniref:LytTR family DNA-binding domain-containing protein n=1 Tax=Neptunicoccus cionae TaxID=2035344 RepID=UPI0015E0BA10|nr:LytTR family DNA-binding domain-containing protein [Amylibacter cionae]